MGNASHLPTWVCAGHDNPQTQAAIFLNAKKTKDTALQGFARVDISTNHVLVELRPQFIAIMVNAKDLNLFTEYPDEFYLTFADPEHATEPNKIFGEIGLCFKRHINIAEYALVLFETTYCKNYCLSSWRIQSHYLYERIKLFFDRNPHNTQKMSSYYLFSNWLLFSMPRAVALVSFDDGQYSNMFPMDLIGPTDSPYYVLSLTSSDPSLPHILKNRRLVVSHVPLHETDNVYAMAKNHKRQSTSREEMIVDTKLSPDFNIPIPVSALCIRELDIVTSFDVDYHTIIISQVRNFERYKQGLHMCHVQRIYQRYLLNQNRALPQVDRLYKRA